MQNRMQVVVAALVILASAANAQGWNILGAGARAEGLGGAFIGLADDATAISWNPSGLGQLERTEFSVVGRWVQEDYKTEFPSHPEFGRTQIQSHFTYNFASIAFPLHAGRVTIVPAVGFQKQLDAYGRTNTEDQEYESSGGANTLTPGIGIKLHPMFYIGGTVNIWLGNFENSTLDKSTKNTSSNEGSYSGLNFTAGLLVDFEGMKNPIPIKLGATIKTPFELEYDGSYKWEQTTTADQSGKFLNKVELPLMYGFGASGRIGENLTLAVDFESRLYGDQRIFFTTDKEPIDTTDLSDSKEDLNQVRVGAEYLIVTSAGVIPIRAGFRTVPTLLADHDSRGNSKDQVSGTGFTVGTGFISQSFAFDVAYSRSKWKQSYEMVGGNLDATNTVQMVSASLIIYF